MFVSLLVLFYFIATAPTEIYTLSLHDALPIYGIACLNNLKQWGLATHLYADDHDDFLPPDGTPNPRSEEHTSELQSLTNLVCRLLLEKKKSSPAPCFRPHSHGATATQHSAATN